MKKSNYVFGATMALTGIASIVNEANAATIAAFTFETSATALAAVAVTAPTVGPFVAESGAGTASASHAGVTTVYSSPAGSGSARSLSANNYTAGDYFQFTVPTTGFNSLFVAFDQVASGTGPKVFNLAYTTNGTTFQNYTSYTLNTGTATSFATAATNSAVNFVFDLSGVAGLTANALAGFRLVEADTTTATGGTARVDNFIVTDTAPTPEPASLAIVALGVGAAVTRRRRS